MTLRQEIADACMYYGCNPSDELLDRIIAAHNAELERIAAGMKPIGHKGLMFETGVKDQLESDKAYVRKEKCQ